MTFQRFVWIALALSCGRAPETARPTPVAPIPCASSAPATALAPPDASTIDAHVPKPSPYTPVAAVLESPDAVEAFTLATTSFVDAPPGTPHMLAGYPVVKPLSRPSAAFVHDFAAIILADDAYRSVAVACSLSEKHIGFRFTRGADIVEIAILTACPSVSGSTTTIGRTGGQLEWELEQRLVTLIRAKYGAAFTR